MVGDDRVVPNGNFQQAGVHGVGIVLGHWHSRGYLACLDVDCYDPAISRALCDFIMERLGRSYPYRVGERPKFAIPVLLTDQWRKVTSAQYGNSRVELLADGQQFVAYGEHPKAKKGYYEWFNGDLSADLPVLSESDLWSIMAEFETQCEHAGMTQTKPSVRERGQVMAEMDDLDVAIANEPLDLADREVKDLLRRYPAVDCDYDDWVRVGAALHHQYRGREDGLKQWKKWSQKDPERYNKGETTRKWQSFGQTGNPVTLRSIIKKSKEQGVKAFVAQQGDWLQSSTGNRLGAGSHINWLVEGIIEQQTIGQIFAPPGVGKTFFALDIAAHLAAGVDWNGHRVKGGIVVYLAGEGVTGINRRLAALEKEKGLDTSNLMVSRMPNFGEPDQLNALMKELRGLPDLPVLIIVDTLARATAGMDENTAKDMGPVVEAMAVFTRELRCAIMAIHHTPKASGGEARGSGVLKGAMDFEIRLEGADDGAVMVSCAKAKDAEEFGEMAFRLESVDLPSNHTDNFGNTVSSAVIDWVDTAEVVKPVKLSAFQTAVVQSYDALWLDVVHHTQTPAAIVREFGLSAPADGLPLALVREHFERGQEGAADTVSKRWRRSLSDVIKKNAMRLYDDILVKI
jgi:hypothetical protein